MNYTNKIKTLFAALVALMAITGSMTGAVAADHGDVVTVDPATDGTVTDEYATIQEAVNNANESAHVQITPGTYTESVNVATNGLSLESTTPGSDVIIDASGVDGNALVIEADNVTVSSDIYVINKTSGSATLASEEEETVESSFDLLDELTKERFGIPAAFGAALVAAGGYYFYREG